MIRVDSRETDTTNLKIVEKLQKLFDTCDKSAFSKKYRPLLMLFNRKSDIQGMLYHSWKYLPLIQDIFGIKNNSFTFESDTFELDFAEGADEILEKNSFIGFHEAGPNVDKTLSSWT